ncbi:MAG: ABC transporter substrate-binding protein [Thermodesulfobacteriota bacterium]
MKQAGKSGVNHSSLRPFWPTIFCLILSLALVSAAPAQMKKGLRDKAKQKEESLKKKQKAELKPQYGGVYRSFMRVDPRSLDTHMETYGATTVITTNTNSTLLRTNPDMTGFELDLAESYKQIDDTTYEFKIHKGVKFHNVPPVNGRELTSADVKYSIERAAGMYGKKTDYKHYYYFDKIKSIETPDKYTVIFKLSQPYAPFLRYIATPWAMITAKEIVDKFGDLKTVAIGTGPFMLKEFVKGSHLTLVKHPNYFKKGLPYLDGITWKIMPDPASTLSAFLAGRLDGAGISDYQVETVRKEAPDALISESPGTHMWILRVQPWIEGSKPLKKPLDDKRVRQAIAMSIDKPRLLKLAQSGNGSVGVGPVPPVFEDALPAADQVKYDPKKAKQLLTEAGYPNGITLELLTWNLEYMTKPAQILKEMLKEVGIDLKMTLLEQPQYFNRAYRFDYELSLHMMTSGVDPEEWMIPYFGPLATSTYYKWSNPELWKLISEQQRILDVKKRKAMLREIQLKVLEDSPCVYLYTTIYFGARRPYVHRTIYLNEAQAMIGETYWMEKH